MIESFGRAKSIHELVWVAPKDFVLICILPYRREFSNCALALSIGILCHTIIAICVGCILTAPPAMTQLLPNSVCQNLWYQTWTLKTKSSLPNNALAPDQIRMLHFYLQHCRGPFSLALSLRAYQTHQRYSARRMQNSGVSPSHV